MSDGGKVTVYASARGSDCSANGVRRIMKLPSVSSNNCARNQARCTAGGALRSYVASAALRTCQR
jgi:hypothetical protein